MPTRSLKTKLRPTSAQKKYLKLGVNQPGGKLPLFDDRGKRIAASTIDACVKAGWCEHWATNPIEPKWLVCKLTGDGENVASK